MRGLGSRGASRASLIPGLFTLSFEEIELEHDDEDFSMTEYECAKVDTVASFLCIP